MNATYTTSPDHCILANIITEAPVPDQKDDLEAIRVELASNRPLLELIQLSQEFAETYTPEELKQLRAEADSEVDTLFPKVAALVDEFWAATFAYSAELAKKRRA